MNETKEITVGRIRKEINYGAIVVDELRAGQFQAEGTITAILKQEVKTLSYYPASSIDNDHQDNVFEVDDFENAGESEPYENVEMRTAFINVPESVTLEAVQNKINSHSGACLYKVLSNSPVLTNNHKSAIESGITTLGELANSQVARFPDSHEETPGKIITDGNGNPQYRKVFFKQTFEDDIDTRNPEKVFMSDEIKEELEDGVDVTIDAEEEVTDQTV